MFQGKEYVWAVYEAGSFSKAAQELFISQPSLSASVKRVEEKVGYAIFDRSTKPLTLTEVGRQYIEAVKAMREREEAFEQFIGDWSDLQTGSLVLGGSNLFASWVLPPIMERFARTFPHIHMELVEETAAGLTELLHEGKIDLMIENAKLDKKEFDAMPLLKESLLLVVPKKFAINETLKKYQLPPEKIMDDSYLSDRWKSVPLETFANVPFLLQKPDNDTRMRSDLILEKAGFMPEVRFELDQQMTAYHIAISGMGAAFISSTLLKANPEFESLVCYKLPGAGSRRTSRIYWKRGRYMTRAMSEFLKIASDEFSIASEKE